MGHDSGVQEKFRVMVRDGPKSETVSRSLFCFVLTKDGLTLTLCVESKTPFPRVLQKDKSAAPFPPR